MLENYAFDNTMSSHEGITPVVIFAMCFDNRCDFNYYTAHRRLTDLPSGLHHSTSVLWLHAKKADFPLEKTQLLAAAEESLCTTNRHMSLSPENIYQSTDLYSITFPSYGHNLFVPLLSQYLGLDVINK